MYQRQSPKTKHRRQSSISSPERWEHNEEKMTRLFEQYTREENNINVQEEWHPLTLKDCRQLYEYAFERYQHQSLNL